jgi:hypothetical protein
MLWAVKNEVLCAEGASLSYFMDVWRKKYLKTKYLMNDILRSPHTGLQWIKSLIYDRFCN